MLDLLLKGKWQWDWLELNQITISHLCTLGLFWVELLSFNVLVEIIPIWHTKCTVIGYLHGGTVKKLLKKLSFIFFFKLKTKTKKKPNNNNNDDSN